MIQEATTTIGYPRLGEAGANMAAGPPLRLENPTPEGSGEDGTAPNPPPDCALSCMSPHQTDSPNVTHEPPRALFGRRFVVFPILGFVAVE